jgi:hypothetical protein
VKWWAARDPSDSCSDCLQVAQSPPQYVLSYDNLLGATRYCTVQLSTLAGVPIASLAKGEQFDAWRLARDFLNLTLVPALDLAAERQAVAMEGHLPRYLYLRASLLASFFLVLWVIG